MRFWQNSLERVITLNAVTWLWRLWGMARRERRRVIEGNERLPLITPCLLSGVHTCFRNILPAQCITRQSLSVAGNVRFQGCPSSVVGYSRMHTDAHIPPTWLCIVPKVSTKPYAEAALARIREREDVVARSAPDRSTSCRSPRLRWWRC